MEPEWFTPAEKLASFKGLFMKVKKKKSKKQKSLFRLFPFFFSLLIFYDLSKAKEEKWEQTAATEIKKKKKGRVGKQLLENSISKLKWKENARDYYRAAFFGESTCSGLAQMRLDPSSCSPVQQAQTDSLEWR